MKKHLFFGFLMSLIVLSMVQTFAEDIIQATSLSIVGAYYPDNNEGYGVQNGFAPVSYSPILKENLTKRSDDPGRNLGSGWGGVEAKVSLNHSITIPMMRMEGPLFSGNNLKIILNGDLSPVHTEGTVSLSLTPIALAKFDVGGSIGTGWNFFGLFNGIGRNLPGISNTGPLADALSGPVTTVWGSGTFQFDFGAIIPGDWTHVITMANVKVKYQHNFSCDANTPWQWAADAGENFNGAKLLQTYFLGYQLPKQIVLRTTGLLIETEGYIDHNTLRSTMASGGWASDFMKIYIAGLFNFELSPFQSFTTLVQFICNPDYTDATIGNRYFQYRNYEGYNWSFYRVALIYGIKL